MASVVTHALLGAAIGGAAQPASWKGPRLWFVSAFCSVLPDADVIGFRFGVHYGDLWGHRGVTHSLTFAAVLAAVMAMIAVKAAWERWYLGLLLFFVTASHGVLDALTNGGLGVAFFSPFNARRYFFPWRPIAVAPIGAHRFFSAHGAYILWTEIIWLWGPILLLAGGVWMWRRARDRSLALQGSCA